MANRPVLTTFRGLVQWRPKNRYPRGMAEDLTFTVTKLRALSLKRLAYMSDLQRTGRWRLQYASEEAFNEALRAADADAERWKRLAYGPPIEAAE